MITCKICKKYAKLDGAWINGAGKTKIAGSCKYCKYKEKANYPKDFPFSQIPESKIEYEDFEELGIEG